jgi:hypothetical protein
MKKAKPDTGSKRRKSGTDLTAILRQPLQTDSGYSLTCHEQIDEMFNLTIMHCGTVEREAIPLDLRRSDVKTL